MAKEIIKATASLVEGLQVKCEARGLSFTIDEPKELGGTDLGMNPMEALLASIGGCKVILAQMFAKAHGIDIKGLRLEFEGTFDLDGMMGKNPDARVGYSDIKTKYYFSSDNTVAELEKFADFIDAHCPVVDTIINSANMSHEIHLV
jgi:uncharacterized OsmC-like protein